MKYRTVEITLTKPQENIGDLMNALALVCFRSKTPRSWAKANFSRILDEQYVQSLLKLPTEEDVVKNKPYRLS